MIVKRPDRTTLIGAALLPVLLLLLGMLARTEIVLGDWVREQIVSRATGVGADVEVLTIAPDGLFGLELEDVSVRIPRGDFAVEAHFESVVVHPAFGSILSGSPKIGTVRLEGGVIGVRPWESAPASPSKSAKTTRPAVAAQPPEPPPERIYDIELVDVDFMAFSSLYRTRPLHFGRLDLEASRERGVVRAVGFGKLPDGVPFQAGDTGLGHLVLKPEKRTHVDRWAIAATGVEPPIAMSTSELRVCARRPCDTLVELFDVELTAPVWRDDVRVTAPEAGVRRVGGELVLGAPEMSIVDPNTDQFAARLTEVDLRYALDSGRLRGDVQLADAEGGTLDFDWSFDAEDFDVDVSAKGFDAASVWHLVPYGDRLRPGRVSGKANLGYDLRHATIDVSTDLRFDRLSAWFHVTRESFDASNVSVATSAYADLAGRSMSLRKLAVGLGDAGPFLLSGSAVHAGRGWSFEATASLERQPVGRLLDNLPRQFGSVISGAVIVGELGFSVHASGHSAFAESLQLTGELDSTVEVERDAPAHDPASLGTTGPPPQLRADAWVPWASLPRHAVDAILAAEDARFFQHDGFDWGGFERAMTHNLREGRLARGGSTISQQVTKNLWLSGEKTLARKLEEAYLTWRLESVHSKRRILEIYLNLADWGRGTRGLEAAAQRYFGAPASQLGTAEVALLAAILPNPHRFGGQIESGRIASSRLQKVEHTLRNLRFMKKISLAEYRKLWDAARDDGKIGRLNLKLCDDDGGAPPGTPKCG